MTGGYAVGLAEIGKPDYRIAANLVERI